MIIEFIVGIFTGGVSWLVGLIPAFAPGALNIGVNAMLSPFATAIDGLGAWLPWDAIQVWLPLTVSLWTGSLVVRAVKSFIPTIS